MTKHVFGSSIKFTPDDAMAASLRAGGGEQTAATSPLASDLFRIKGVNKVFFGPGFVTGEWCGVTADANCLRQPAPATRLPVTLVP